MRMLRRRFPDEPFRQRLGAMAEHLRRTRGALTEARMAHAGRYDSVADFLAELAELSDALVGAGLARVAWGDVAELRWQAETFGFHLASLEVRQHAAVHAATLAALREPAANLAADLPTAPSVSAAEVLATFRAMAEVQRRFGEDACRRYIVSFTRGVGDVAAVLELACLAEMHFLRRRGHQWLPGGDPDARRRRCSSRLTPWAGRPTTRPTLTSLPIGATRHARRSPEVMPGT
jgi:phosphoenolpyruvate carboxylase